ncbi:MAG: hypothetical protein LBT59_09265 [Clostridiales bacterium]|jgi:16S rRNA G966 N2-methylase RsmD|nr:hypothetical protein [Clostridiales bacterium]
MNENLYKKPLPSSRAGLFYNTFAYPAKISPESVALCIAAHTKLGDVALDVFGGSGTTGIAALMCEHPEEEIKTRADKLELSVEWGARSAILIEIGKFGAFASEVMANPPDPQEFYAAMDELLREACLSDIYESIDPFGGAGVMRHMIHSDMLKCPSCGNEFSYCQGMVSQNPFAISKSGKCPHCQLEGPASCFSYQMETCFDTLLGVSVTRRKRVPAKVYGKTGNKNWSREANDSDIQKLAEIDRIPYPDMKPKLIQWGELHRGCHAGITHLHHFYTKRNFLAMSWLWERAEQLSGRLGDAAKLLILSYNAAHSTLMTRVVAKKGSKDFVLTGAQSGVLYISSLPVEKNIFTGLRRKLPGFVDAFSYLGKCNGHITVLNQSSQSIPLPDKSVDYVFTDPPFGDFIPYAEVNQINELWLGEPTDRGSEIIVSPSQGKEVKQYQEMMSQVFAEMKRVMKDGAFATLVFHSSKAAIWNALRSAFASAGFHVVAASSLEKSQASFKQVVSDSSVQGDPLLLLAIGDAKEASPGSIGILDEAIQENPNETDRKIYAAYISRCLERGALIEMDSKVAYDYIKKKKEIKKDG